MTPCANLKGGLAPDGGYHEDAIRVIARDDADYPPALRMISDPPAQLYVRGTLRSGDAMAVAIVGARRATEYGKAAARRLAADLAAAGVTIISGMALGIDGSAHEGALAGGGRTVAVLGCGPDIIYPKSHTRMMREITRSGAVVTEFPPGTPPRPEQFPQRNRLISGMARGVVIVEGRMNSGSLITADFALEQGREVFAVPGNIFEETSRAPHRLLTQGARLVETAGDVLEELGWARGSGDRPSIVLRDDLERAVWTQLTLAPQHLDRIAALCGQPVAITSRVLLVLEARGLVSALAGQRYVKRM